MHLKDDHDKTQKTKNSFHINEKPSSLKLIKKQLVSPRSHQQLPHPLPPPKTAHDILDMFHIDAVEDIEDIQPPNKGRRDRPYPPPPC